MSSFKNYVLLSGLMILVSLTCFACSKAPPRFPETQREWTAEARVATATLVDLQASEKVLGWYATEYDTGKISRDIDSARRKLIGMQDPLVLQRINEARELILRSPNPDDVYQWPLVREIVAEIGVTIPVIALSREQVTREDGSHYRMGVIFDIVAVDREDFLQEDIVVSAGILSHEATHLAFSQEIRNYTGFNQIELELLDELCLDFKFASLFSTEALAFWNQSSSMLTLLEEGAKSTGGLVERAQGENFMENYFSPMQNFYAFGARTHPDFFFEKWADSLVQYIVSKLKIEEVAKDPNRTMYCGPPVILNGRHRGEYVNFVRFAPRPLAPLFTFLQKRMRILQYLGKI